MGRTWIFAGALVAAAAGAGCGTDPDTSHPGAAQAALIGGTPDRGDPAVVLLQTTGPDGGECTAELVSTTVLLTAAHCVRTERGMPLTGAAFRIYRGHDLADAQEADWIPIDADDVHAHPGFVGDDHDIAVLVLDEPVRVTPLPLATAALSAADIGKPVRLVGYGASVVGAGDDGFGIKRELTTSIVGVEPSWVEVGEAGKTACDGDSGGPALLEIDGVETIVGLDSFSDADIDCSATELYQRVDVEAEFIAQFLSAPGGGGGAGGTMPSAGASSAAAGAPGLEAGGGCSIDSAHGHRWSTSGWALAIVLALGLARARSRRRA